MKSRSPDSFNTLIAVLEREIQRLDVVVDRNRQAADRLGAAEPTWMEYVVVAHTLHNAYSLMEGYFLRIAKFFENEIGNDSWHKDLVQRMTVEIESVRPALLTAEVAQRIDELRGFRHLYRNLYDTDLKPDRIIPLQAQFPDTIDRFQAAHRRFIAALRLIARGVR